MTKKQTFGEKAVRLSHNPSKFNIVDITKKNFADIIDNLDEARNFADNSEIKRACSVAITEAETACMWAVKAYTTEF